MISVKILGTQIVQGGKGKNGVRHDICPTRIGVAKLEMVSDPIFSFFQTGAPGMTHKALGLMPTDAITRDFMVARAMAIAQYAMLENSLVLVFSHLLGVSEDVGGIPFFKINNARARNSMIERLLKKRHQAAYNLFWNSTVRLLQDLDARRNEIVHWAISTTMNTDLGGKVTELKLIPPNFWDSTSQTPELALTDLYDFCVKCEYVLRTLDIFHAVLNPRFPIPPAWLDICQQASIYPPPDNHPLSQI